MSDATVQQELMSYFGHESRAKAAASPMPPRLTVARKYPPASSVEVNGEQFVTAFEAMAYRLGPEFSSIGLGDLVATTARLGLTELSRALASLPGDIPAVYLVRGPDGRPWSGGPSTATAAVVNDAALEAELTDFFGWESE